MVQYIQASPQQVASQQRLGQNIAGQLQNFLNQHYSNNALGTLENDPEYQKMPVSARASKLEQALRPLGEYGQQILKNKLPIEQLRGEEQQQLQQRQQQQQAASQLWEMLHPGTSLPQGIGPKEILELEKIKSRAPAGGLSGQAVPPQIAQAIPQILNANKDKSAEELALAFDESGIPRAYSNSYIETRRKEDEQKGRVGQLKTEKKVGRDEEIIKKVDESRKSLAIKKASTEVMKNAILNNDMGFFSLANLSEKPGFEWAATTGASSFKAAQKNHLISTISQITGQKNQWIEKQITDSYAKIGRPQDANMAALAITEFEGDATEAWNNIVDKLDEQGNYPPGKLGSEASRKMEVWYTQNIKKLNKQIDDIANGKIRPEEFSAPEGTVTMYAPDGGVLYVKPEEVEKYKALGASQSE